MGSSRTTETRTETQQTTPQATEEEKELQKIQLGQAREFDPLQREINQLGGTLVSRLLAGEALPGRLGPLGSGTDPSELVQEAISDVRPGLQQAGLFDSGVRAEVETRTAGDIRRASQDSDRNRLFNLLNLAIGAPAQIQAPVLSVSSQLGQRLAGLRTITQTGSQTSSQVQRQNPFLVAASFSPFGSFGSSGFGFGSRP